MLNTEVQTAEQLPVHTHNGVDSTRLFSGDVIPFFTMTATQITTYTAQNSVDGSCFNVYDSTNNKYYYYARLNKVWKKIELT